MQKHNIQTEIPPIAFHPHFWVAKELMKFKPNTVADLGGNGRLSQFINLPVTDISPKTGQDATNINFLNNIFDVAISINTLEHVGDESRQLKFLSESLRVTKKAVLHWFLLGEKAAKVEQIKKQYGHRHPCVVPTRKLITDFGKHPEIQELKIINVISAREHLLSLAMSKLSLPNSVYFEMLYNHYHEFSEIDLYAVLLIATKKL